MADRFLEVEERKAVVRLIAGLYDFTDQGPRGRRVFLQSTAGLGRFVPGLDLSGDPTTVAADLVGRLEVFGPLPERQSYHALGALLSAVLDLDEVATAKREEAARLILRYRLVDDEAFLSGLGERFGIDAAPAAAAVAPAAPARVRAPAAAGPAFAPAIADETGLETIIHSGDNFLDVELLTGALYCAKAVARIEIPENDAKGTGFLVGPDLLLTNQHVVKDKRYLEEAVARFGCFIDAAGVEIRGTTIGFDHSFYFSSPAEQLDYALLRLAQAPLASLKPGPGSVAGSVEELGRLGKHLGYLTLAPRLLADGSRVNIIQHPNGDPLKVVLTQNYVVQWTDTRLQYVADTMEGSSGSPVFNRRWEVVGLHHSGTPYPPDGLANKAKRAWKGKFRVNEGIPIRAILEDLTKKGLDRYLPRT